MGYTGERLLVGTEALYSRSWTAWDEDLPGGEVSEVALGTDVDEVCEGMVEWSSVQKP